MPTLTIQQASPKAYCGRCPAKSPKGTDEEVYEWLRTHMRELHNIELESPVGKSDAVNHPSHYGGDSTYETIKVCEAWELDQDAYLFNVVKYISRAGKKDDILQDLKKAAFYLDRRIKRIEDARGSVQKP